MMFKVEPVFLEIEERLKSWIAAQNLGVAVEVGTIENSEDMQHFETDGQLRPTILVDVPVVNEAYRSRGITGVRDDMGVLDMSLLLLVPSARWLPKLLDIVRDCLLGYQPANCGPIYQTDSRAAGSTRSANPPTRYVAAVGIAMSVGTTVVP